MSAAQELTLVKESLLFGDYALVSTLGEELAWLRGGFLGAAEGRTAASAWTFSRPRGWLRPSIMVTDLASGAGVLELAVRSRGPGGSFAFGGEPYQLRQRGVLRQRWVMSRSGSEVLTLVPSGWLGRERARLTVAASLPDPLLLSLLTVHARLSAKRKRSFDGGGGGD